MIYISILETIALCPGFFAIIFVCTILLIMIYKFITLVLVVLISSCTSIPSSPEKSASLKNLMPSDENLAVVFIVRSDAKIVNTALTAQIGIDQQLIVQLNTNVFTRVEISPGRHNFKFAVTRSEYNKTRSKYPHGRQNLLIKPGVVNIIRFDNSDFKFSNKMLYGKKHLENMVAGAYFQIPYKPIVMITKTPPAEKHITKSVALITNKSALKSKQKEISAHFVQLQARAKCKLKNTNWAYTGINCKKGLAHGKGIAEDTQGLKFIGTFASGHRTKGEIHQNGNMIFSGSLVDDKPEGNAICSYEGEYEECRFYKGKRIDSLYKIRKESSKLKAEMAKNRVVQPARLTSTQEKGITDYAVDALEKEATDRAVDYIFDKLF